MQTSKIDNRSSPALIRRRSSLNDQLSTRCSFFRDPLLTCILATHLIDGEISIEPETIQILDYLNLENADLRKLYSDCKKVLLELDHHSDFQLVIYSIDQTLSSKLNEFTTLEKLELIRIGILTSIFGHYNDQDLMYKKLCDWLEKIRLVIRKADDSSNTYWNNGGLSRKSSLPTRKDSIKCVKRYLPTFFGQIWMELLSVQRFWNLSPPLDSPYAGILDKLNSDLTVNANSFGLMMAGEVWAQRNVILVPGTALRFFGLSSKMVVLRCDVGRISLFDVERFVLLKSKLIPHYANVMDADEDDEKLYIKCRMENCERILYTYDVTMDQWSQCSMPETDVENDPSSKTSQVFTNGDTWKRSIGTLAEGTLHNVGEQHLIALTLDQTLAVKWSGEHNFVKYEENPLPHGQSIIGIAGVDFENCFNHRVEVFVDTSSRAVWRVTLFRRRGDLGARNCTAERLFGKSEEVRNVRYQWSPLDSKFVRSGFCDGTLTLAFVDLDGRVTSDKTIHLPASIFHSKKRPYDSRFVITDNYLFVHTGDTPVE